MSTSQKVCLNWKNFQQNISNAFRHLRSDDDFADVTLACEDGKQLSVHKVILASSSTFFMNILKKYKSPQPLIFMRGVKSEELSAIVDFLYFGETQLEQENLESFLAVAEDLKILGLSRAAELVKDGKIPPGKGDVEPISKSTVKVEEVEEGVEIEETDISSVETSRPGDKSAGLPKQMETFADEDDTRTKVMSLMEFSKKKVMSILIFID